MADVIIRDYETMVDDAVDQMGQFTSITNFNSGSVIRTIIEILLSEVDVQYYMLQRILDALSLDRATGVDLDDLVSILSIVRNPAETFQTTVTFIVEEPNEIDVAIPIGTAVSTLPDSDDNVIEFRTIEVAVLRTGELSVNVKVQSVNGGYVHLPIGSITVMDDSIVNIDEVTNLGIVDGGTDIEDDDTFRERAKNYVQALGKGTLDAIITAIKAVPGVILCIGTDMPNDIIGTATMYIVTNNMPPTADKKAEILDVVNKTKSAGIYINLIYPNIQGETVTMTFNPPTTDDTLRRRIYDEVNSYFNTLTLNETVIKSQIMKYALNAVNNEEVDINITIPTGNITVTGDNIARLGVMTIDGNIIFNE
jgi:uncharacterized phage protein gp47/JayE